MKFVKRLMLAVTIIAPLFCPQTNAFNYNDGDLLLCFRQDGGSYNMVVNLGPADQFKALNPGAALAASEYNTNQLMTAFQDLSNLRWSVFGALVSPADTSNIPANTIWASQARSNPAIPASPITRGSDDRQSALATPIISAGFGAVTLSGLAQPDPVFNTDQVIIELAGQNESYGTFVGPNGDFNAFYTTLEAITSATFGQDNLPIRCDFFELTPSTISKQPGTNLGFFEFKADGTMSFHAYSAEVALAAPKAQIQMQAQSVVVTFNTETNANYILHATNAAGLHAPASTWPAIQSSISGDGSSKSVTVNATNNIQFFVIEASR